MNRIIALLLCVFLIASFAVSCGKEKRNIDDSETGESIVANGTQGRTQGSDSTALQTEKQGVEGESSNETASSETGANVTADPSSVHTGNIHQNETDKPSAQTETEEPLDIKEVVVPDGATTALDVSAPYIEGNDWKTPVQVNSSTAVGISFVIGADSWVEDIVSFCPSYSDNLGSLTISVYKWNKTYSKTISGTPVYETVHKDFVDNAHLYDKIDNKKITDGKYVILYHNGTGGVGLWCKKPVKTTSEAYKKYQFTPILNGQTITANVADVVFGIRTLVKERNTGAPESKAADYVRDGWLLSGIPSYDYGTMATGLYNCGQGVFTGTMSSSKDSKMLCINDTNSAEYGKFIEKLAANGFTKEFHNQIGKNLYDTYVKGEKRVYSYYTESDGLVKIIDDKTSTSINSFEYSHSKKAGETTEIYQCGLVMSPVAISEWTKDNWVACGMSYVIKLADNSIVMIDGGEFMQYDNTYCKDFLEFLHEITHTSDSEKINVAAWYVSHGHNDHNSGFAYFMEKYHTSLNVERTMFNMPDFNTSVTGLKGSSSYAKKGYTTLLHYWPGLKDIKLHTGEKFTLGDVSFEILYTHEDLVNTATGKSVSSEFNESSTVMMVTVDGKKIMITGDVNTQGESYIMSHYESATLKCDIFQGPHHCVNSTFRLYAAADAPILLLPTSRIQITGMAHLSTFVEEVSKGRSYYTDGDVFYGFKVENGAFNQCYTRKVVGGKYTGWSWNV